MSSNPYKQKSIVKGVSYSAMCASHRASLGYHTSQRSAPSTSQSPIYYAPSPLVVDLSPMPAQGIESIPSEELFMEVYALRD